MLTSTTSITNTSKNTSTDTTFTSITAIDQAEFKCTATNDTSFSSAALLHRGWAPHSCPQVAGVTVRQTTWRTAQWTLTKRGGISIRFGDQSSKSIQHTIRPSPNLLNLGQNTRKPIKPSNRKILERNTNTGQGLRRLWTSL